MRFEHASGARFVISSPDIKLTPENGSAIVRAWDIVLRLRYGRDKQLFPDVGRIAVKRLIMKGWSKTMTVCSLTQVGRVMKVGLICSLLTALPVQAKRSKRIVEAVRARVIAHGFDGTILIGEANGREAHFTTDPEIQPDAVWRWASITKQLAAVLVMQEVQHGRISLDQPVSKYWPDWHAPYATSARIRDLLLHNSGLPQPDASPADADGVPGFYRASAMAPQSSANGYCAGTPMAKPPAAYEYNNCDTIVLAQVLARVTGKSFEALIRERLSGPAKMSSVGIYALGGRPPGHVEPNGEFANLDGLLDLGVFGASGGAYGTITDLWRFDHALLTGRFLSKPMREAMWQSNKNNGFYGFHQWIYPAPLRACGKPVRIVERQGLVGGMELRNYILPETGRALIMFSRHRPTNLGDPYEGSGFAFDMLSMVACRKG